MAFQFHDIKTYEARPGELFLFDANIWIHYLNVSKPSSNRKHCVQFLDYLYDLAEEPTILLPAAILSEVLNRVLKDVYQPKFLNSEAGKKAIIAAACEPKDYYKKIYRPHQQYYNDRKVILASIFSYSNNIQLVDDGFSKYDVTYLETANTDLDFNDWMVFELARRHNATIVSDDSDFMIENWPIVTNRYQLLAKNAQP